jgi:hypothetical protein
MRKYIVARSGYVDIGLRTLLKQALPHVPMRDLSAELKRQALFFDQISIYNADFYFEQIRKGPLYHNHSSWLNEFELEIQWLLDRGVVIDLEKTYAERLKISSSEMLNAKTKHVNDSFDLIIGYLKNPDIGTNKLVENLVESDAIRLREYVLNFADSKELQVLSALGLKDYLYDIPNSRRQEVVEVIVSNLPVPSATTPWEKIIDYRDDSENQKILRSLRRWISKLTSSDLPTSEIEEELDVLIDEYQSHMRLHKLKVDTEILQTLVKVPFELIEDLLKLRFSKIPEPFFALHKRKISLMETELQAPGREISYVLKARDAFPSEE